MHYVTCEKCIHSKESDVNPADLRAPRVLQCRARPPQVLALGMTPEGLATSSVWPTVHAGESCGLGRVKTLN